MRKRPDSAFRTPKNTDCTSRDDIGDTAVRLEAVILFIVLATLLTFAAIVSFDADDCRSRGGMLVSTPFGGWACSRGLP